MKVMRSKLVPILLEHARRSGLDIRALADRFELPDETRSLETWSLDAPGLAIDRVVSLADALSEALADPWLGLHLAIAIPRGAFGVQEFAVRNAPSLGEAANRLVRYQRLTNDGLVWAAEHGEGIAQLTCHVPSRSDGLGPHLDVFLIAVALRFIRELSETAMDPREVKLAHSPRGLGAGPLSAFFGTERISWGGTVNALVFSEETWDRPVPGADPTLLSVLDEYAQRLMPLEDAQNNFTARVRDHLRRQLSGGAPTIESAARATGTTARSLQRRLHEAGTSYSEVLDHLRETEARRLMADTAVSIDEASFLLGYSERRAFVRAFARWTGTSPTAYRAAGRSE